MMRNIINGHSGCKVELQSQNNNSVEVIKSTHDKHYISRLDQQAKKQIHFLNENDNSLIKAPRIYRIDKDENYCKIYMEYIFANNFIDYFNNSSVKVLDLFIENIIKFIYSEITKSQTTSVEIKIFEDKVSDVLLKIDNNSVANSYKNISTFLYLCNDTLSIKEDLTIPVGHCHGDLTLSNILFKGNEIYLIDFLDSFIETPLMDIVKLRQDTYHSWSYKLYEKKYDHTRNQIILNYIDKALVSEFIKLDFYQKFYNKFQILNLLRVLQYVKDAEISKYLIENIYKLIGK